MRDQARVLFDSAQMMAAIDARSIASEERSLLFSLEGISVDLVIYPSEGGLFVMHGQVIDAEVECPIADATVSLGDPDNAVELTITEIDLLKLRHQLLIGDAPSFAHQFPQRGTGQGQGVERLPQFGHFAAKVANVALGLRARAVDVADLHLLIDIPEHDSPRMNQLGC